MARIGGPEFDEESAGGGLSVRLIGLSLGRTRTRRPAPMSNKQDEAQEYSRNVFGLKGQRQVSNSAEYVSIRRARSIWMLYL